MTSFFRFATSLISVTCLASFAGAANVLLVTDNSPAPDPGTGIADLLTDNGHAVTFFDFGTYGWNLGSNNGVDFANSFDLIVVTRNVNYGAIRGHGATWNALTTPMVNLHQYLVGGPFSAASWSWTGSSGGVANGVDNTALAVADASDPIWAGVGLTDGDTLTPDLYSASAQYWNSSGQTLLAGVTPLATNPSDPAQIAVAYAPPNSLRPGGAAQYFIATANGEVDTNVFNAEGETLFLNAVDTLAIPEPGSLLMLGLGGLLMVRRQRR